jgi:adenine-specific DNA-methyltransferase
MIRSELDVLLDKVQDPALRADLRSQIDRLKQRRSFGLVFEQHIPERVRLPQHPVRVGSQVVSRDDDDSPTFEVTLIDDGVATLVRVRDPDGAYVERSEHGLDGQERAPVDSLVVISDFGEAVLPGLRHLGSVERGGDKPYHVVIKGENHHALEALRFTHAGKVDCIYIDPPYNSGARDWKYDNDYVDDTDAYRHSKWLAFMERRLKLARELLNPADSVLIVTIDEREYLRLGMLMEQLFPHAQIEMVTSVISGKGVARFGQFSRVEEYVFTLRIGSQEVALSETNMLDGSRSASERVGQPVDWLGLRRREPSARRGARPRQFYPVFVDTTTGFVHSIGDAIINEVDRVSVDAPIGTFVVWPLRPDGTEGLWGITPETARAYLARGYLRSRNYKPGTGYVAVQYLPGGTVAGIEADDIEVTGRDQDGSVIAFYKSAKGVIPKRVWNMASHNAETGGTVLLSRLLPNRRFPFPKSLYAVEDTIRFFVKDKPHAVVLDFFAGSGTTAHAVARLNRQDGGRRQCILVTNNEVSADEANDLRNRGLRPGEPEWEALGIFEHITRPRVTAAITGRTPDGEPIVGDYKFADEFPMADGFEENVDFLELRYLDADDVDLGHVFDDIAPLLWLRAGGRGPIARRLNEAGAPLPYAWTDRYGVLFDEDRWRGFVSARPETATVAFIVTYSPTVFAGIAAELPAPMDTVRLYDTYLSMFLPGRGRA